MTPVYQGMGLYVYTCILIIHHGGHIDLLLRDMTPTSTYCATWLLCINNTSRRPCDLAIGAEWVMSHHRYMYLCEMESCHTRDACVCMYMYLYISIYVSTCICMYVCISYNRYTCESWHTIGTEWVMSHYRHMYLCEMLWDGVIYHTIDARVIGLFCRLSSLLHNRYRGSHVTL